MRIVHSIKLSLFLGLGFHFIGLGQGDSLQRLPYNNPGLVVDLGVGLWALGLADAYGFRRRWGL